MNHRFLEAMKPCSCGSGVKTIYVDMNQKCHTFKALLDLDREFDYKRLYCEECMTEEKHDHWPYKIQKITAFEE